MKVVLDTNVLVSGFLTRTGNCAVILNLILDGRITTCLDCRIIEEYRRVCADPRLHLDQQTVHTVLDLLISTAEHITPFPWKKQLPDTDDMPFLETAMTAEAVLITGNMKHFPAHSCGSVTVMSPSEYLAFYSTHKGIA
jgi:uncharacterized protein